MTQQAMNCSPVKLNLIGEGENGGRLLSTRSRTSTCSWNDTPIGSPRQELFQISSDYGYQRISRGRIQPTSALSSRAARRLSNPPWPWLSNSWRAVIGSTWPRRGRFRLTSDSVSESCTGCSVSRQFEESGLCAVLILRICSDARVSGAVKFVVGRCRTLLGHRQQSQITLLPE